MICPACGTAIRAGRSKFDLRQGCPNCGWGQTGSERFSKSRKEGQYDVSYGQWIVCWILAIAFVVGPYVAIRAMAPPWATPEFLYKYYWLGWGIYLLMALLLSPKPDMDNLGYWGGMIDNPFAISDDINRFLLFLALILVPGKIILGAILGTPRHLLRPFRK